VAVEQCNEPDEVHADGPRPSQVIAVLSRRGVSEVKPLALGAALLLAGCSAKGPIRVSATPVTACEQKKTELTVVVQDEMGGIIPGAQVSLDGKGRVVASAGTDMNGRASFVALPSLGPFSVRSELPGFDVSHTTAFRLQPGCNTTVRVHLRLLKNGDCIIEGQSVVKK
jgi:Carboxypeptidase regulatory-like domain